MSKSLNPNQAVVITLCTDSDKRRIEKYLKDVLTGQKPHFATWVDGSKASRALKARGTPSNFIIDGDGTVRFFHRGLGEWNLKRFQQEIDALVSEKAS